MILEIEVTDKIAKLMPGECQVIVCDNTDYSVHFTFDEEWDESDIKTARFIYGDEQYTDVPFTGDTVAVPKLTDTKYVLIGVFVDDLQSTTAAKVLVLESIRTPDGDPIDPTSAVYDTIIELINSKPHLSESDVQGIIAEYLAAHPETDPTVPAWAKAETKPSYTADEVGAYTKAEVDAAIATAETETDAKLLSYRTVADSYTKAEVDAKVADIDLSEYAKTADIPTKTSQLTNDSGYLTEHQSLADYRLISDSYSKSETDTLLASAGKVKTVNGVEPDASGNIEIEGGTGKDGTTFTPSVSADGTLSWTNDGGKDNPASVNIKGADGAKGADGTNGKDGTSVTVTSVSESTADGGSNVVTFSDGKAVTIKNGSKGSDGTPYTLTDADKTTITNAVIAALPKYGGAVE